uniref:Uncharacterized protein n=1 Tax=Arundo donax TaxID=35708 RepID=A0A0A9H7A4_ARUDO
MFCDSYKLDQKSTRFLLYMRTFHEALTLVIQDSI